MSSDPRRAGSPPLTAAAARVHTARRWWWAFVVTGTVLFGLVYWLAVHTVTGQRLENAALRGALQVNAVEVTDADEILNRITVGSLLLAIAVIALIGFIRGGIRLAAIGGGTVVVSLGVAEVLKRYLLPRPDLIGAPETIAHNSFPSGHTTIAMSVLVAVLIVMPWRWRGLAMIIVMTWAIGVGAYTVTARWHRVSDTLGADLLALVVGSLAALLLLRGGEIRVVTERARVVRMIYVGVMALVLVLAAVSGIIIAAYASQQPLDEVITDYNLFLAAQTFASLGSIATALLAWGSWHRLETAPRRHR